MLFQKGIMCTRSISTLLLNQIWILVLFCQMDSEIYLHSIYLTDFPTIWHQGYWLYVSYGKSSCTLWNYSYPICMYMFYDIIYEMEGEKNTQYEDFFSNWGAFEYMNSPEFKTVGSHKFKLWKWKDTIIMLFTIILKLLIKSHIIPQASWKLVFIIH